MKTFRVSWIHDQVFGPPCLKDKLPPIHCPRMGPFARTTMEAMHMLLRPEVGEFEGELVPATAFSGPLNGSSLLGLVESGAADFSLANLELNEQRFGRVHYSPPVYRDFAAVLYSFPLTLSLVQWLWRRSPFLTLLRNYTLLFTLKLTASRLTRLFNQPLPLILPFMHPGDIVRNSENKHFVVFSSFFFSLLSRDRIQRFVSPTQFSALASDASFWDGDSALLDITKTLEPAWKANCDLDIFVDLGISIPLHMVYGERVKDLIRKQAPSIVTSVLSRKALMDGLLPHLQFRKCPRDPVSETIQLKQIIRAVQAWAYLCFFALFVLIERVTSQSVRPLGMHTLRHALEAFLPYPKHLMAEKVAGVLPCDRDCVLAEYEGIVASIYEEAELGGIKLRGSKRNEEIVTVVESFLGRGELKLGRFYQDN